MISKKQKAIYDFICTYSKEQGIPPSLKEIAEYFSDTLTYPSSAHYHVKKLQEEDYLERDSNKPRSISIHPDRAVKSPFLKKSGLDAVRIPLLGSVNAGPATIFAEENIEGYLKVSRNDLKRKDQAYALRVEGNSMNQAKINGKNLEEGDFVLVDPEETDPKDGDYVVSVIDDCANIKKFEKDKKTGVVKLISESSDPTYKPIFVSSEDDFMVNGTVVNVIKK